VLLGLGPDAHVASLFPGHDTLDVQDRVVVGEEEAGHEPYVPRVSLTLRTLCDGRHIVFLVSGESKADAVERAFGREASKDAPGSLVRPRDGRMTVLLDPAAASRLRP
jgi:6-phosphogluconolactonase